MIPVTSHFYTVLYVNRQKHDTTNIFQMVINQEYLSMSINVELDHDLQQMIFTYMDVL